MRQDVPQLLTAFKNGELTYAQALMACSKLFIKMLSSAYFLDVLATEKYT